MLPVALGLLGIRLLVGLELQSLAAQVQVAWQVLVAQQAKVALGELEEMGVTPIVVIYLGLIFAPLAPLGLPAALVAQAVLAVLAAMVATGAQLRP